MSMEVSGNQERSGKMSIKAVEQKGVLDGTYRKIADDLINNGYPIGTKLQPLRALANNYNVSYMTVQKAIKVLQMQGALTAKPGDGIYVTGRPKPLDGQVAEYLENLREEIPNGHRNGAKARPAARTHSLCVIMPYWISEKGSAYIYSIIKGILAASDPHHWSVELIHNSGDETCNESSHPDFIDKIEQREPEGIIWLQPILTHQMNIMRLIDRGHKVVTTGRSFRDVPVPCVHMDYPNMAELVSEYFIAKGCRKVVYLPGYLEGQFEDLYSVEIINTFMEVMDRKGAPIPEEHICQAGYRPIHKKIVKAFVQENPDLDGIVCFHEHILEEIEKLDREGFFSHAPRKIQMVDVSGIFNAAGHSMEHIEHMNIEWPLENMGRAVIREFENEWLDTPPAAPIDLGVKLIS